MAFIEKELLLSRVQYLRKISEKPGQRPIDQSIIEKINSMIVAEDLLSFMQVEAVFNYLVDKSNADSDDIERHAADILEFIS